MDEKLKSNLHRLLLSSDWYKVGIEGKFSMIEQAFLSSPEWFKEHGYVKVEPAEGELISKEQRKAVWRATEKMLGFPNAVDWAEAEDDAHAVDYCEAQLAHDKARYQELQGICNRLMQNNAELTEKMARMLEAYYSEEQP